MVDVIRRKYRSEGPRNGYIVRNKDMYEFMKSREMMGGVCVKPYSRGKTGNEQIGVMLAFPQ